MRIAFTSSDGVTVDQHFGQTRDFRIWEVDATAAVEVDTVSALPVSEDEEDRIAARANAVAGCAIVYTVAIGGPPAAKLVARRIHPLKTGAEVPIAGVIAKLQEVLRGNPPPWLRKAMGGAPAAGTADERREETAMSYVTGRTRGGKEWTPRFMKAIDPERCIGCGRCIKICAHEVLAPAEVDEEESAKMFAKVENAADCIGCEACGRTCKKEAFSFEAIAA